MDSTDTGDWGSWGLSENPFLSFFFFCYRIEAEAPFLTDTWDGDTAQWSISLTHLTLLAPSLMPGRWASSMSHCAPTVVGAYRGVVSSFAMSSLLAARWGWRLSSELDPTWHDTACLLGRGLRVLLLPNVRGRISGRSSQSCWNQEAWEPSVSVWSMADNVKQKVFYSVRTPIFSLSKRNTLSLGLFLTVPIGASKWRSAVP